MNKTRRKGHQKGFTIIELILSIVILGIVGVFTFSFLGNNMSAYVKEQQHKLLYDQGRLAMKYIAREIRDANRNANINTPGGGQELQFTRVHPSSTNIHYKFSGTSLTRNDNSVGGSYYILAGNVSAFNASYNSGTQIVTVELVLTLTGVGTVKFRTEIYPRNSV